MGKKITIKVIQYIVYAIYILYIKFCKIFLIAYRYPYNEYIYFPNKKNC